MIMSYGSPKPLRMKQKTEFPPLHIAVLALIMSASPVTYGFGFDDVAKKAAETARAPYKKPDTTLPPTIADLDYDQYRDIRYKSDQDIWRRDGLPFELAFFHRGHFFSEGVKINEISADGVHEIHFSPAQFDYGANKIDSSQLQGLGYAGFRVHYAVNKPSYKDEVLVFLGSSYFRALGSGQRYGASARGLAIDTGLSSGEEFPCFREFWIEKPQAGTKILTIYALLDSPRASGAYRFLLSPGNETAVDVKARLFLRSPVGTLGIAPLTSMFFFGANQHTTQDDYRPQVHDSDGLSVHSGTGEWLWRALTNPARLLTSSFTVTNPAGFGLMQRERSAQQYQDIEARYEMRPSVWVEPKGSWGTGRIELVQIPAPDETHDNIVAYWVPATQPAPGQPYDFSYRLHWQNQDPARPPQSWVTQTRRGQGFQRKPDNSIGFIVDFAGPALAKLPPDTRLDGVVSSDANGQILEANTYHNDISGGERLTLRLHRLDDSKPVELRAFLRHGKDTVSETWSYLLPPG
jgi:glucans biosynthesis protein